MSSETKTQMRKRISQLHSTRNVESNEYKLARIWPLCPLDCLECAKPPLPSAKPLFSVKNCLLCCGNHLSPCTVDLAGSALQQVKMILVRLCFKNEHMGIFISLKVERFGIYYNVGGRRFETPTRHFGVLIWIDIHI